MSPARKIPWSKEVEPITPALAQEWIDAYNKTNHRHPTWSKVRDYADQMKAGEWDEEHPDGIQFDWFGNMGNGQHRLLALITADRTVRMFVERGIDPKHFRYTDKGKVRTGADDLDYAGFRKDVSSQKAFAVARRMLMGFGNTSPLGRSAHDFAMKYQDLIGTLMLELKGAKPYRSEVTAAFAKATFEWPESKVCASAQRFATKRFSGDRGDPLSKLHDKVVDFRVNGGKASDLYSFAVSAIRADMENRKISYLYHASFDFVGPWEEGYVPLVNRERGRKGQQTFAAELRTGDVATKAKEALEKAREKGFSFHVNEEGELQWDMPQGTSPTLLKRVREFRVEIAELVSKEGSAHTAERPTQRPRFIPEKKS